MKDGLKPIPKILIPPKDEETVAVVDIDMKRSEHVRRWWPFLRDRRIEAFGPLAKRFRD